MEDNKKKIPIRKVIIVIFYILAIICIFLFSKEKIKNNELTAQNAELLQNVESLQKDLADKKELTEQELAESYDYFFDLGYKKGKSLSNYQKGYDDAVSSYQDKLDSSYDNGYYDGFNSTMDEIDSYLEDKYNQGYEDGRESGYESGYEAGYDKRNWFGELGVVLLSWLFIILGGVILHKIA